MKLIVIIFALLFLSGCKNLTGHEQNNTIPPQTTVQQQTTGQTTGLSISSVTADPKSDLNDLLGEFSFSTPIKDFSKGRLANIKLACKKLNGKIIKPSEEFSFNFSVGPRTMQKGYRKAIIFVNGDKVMEIGGGICQISSTVYNAALNAGFEIVEVHRHGLPVSYVAKGKDATVFYGYKDLRFINTWDRTIKLSASYDGKFVHVSFKPE